MPGLGYEPVFARLWADLFGRPFLVLIGHSSMSRRGDRFRLTRRGILIADLGALLNGR
jgi:hypothetical protein